LSTRTIFSPTSTGLMPRRPFRRTVSMDDCALCNLAPVECLSEPTQFGILHTCSNCCQTYQLRRSRDGPAARPIAAESAKKKRVALQGPPAHRNATV